MEHRRRDHGGSVLGVRGRQSRSACRASCSSAPGRLSVLDPTQAPAGKHTTYCWHVMPFEPDLGGQNYEDFKREFAEKIIETFARYCPNLTRRNIIGQYVYTAKEYTAELINMRRGDIFMGAFNAEQVMYNHFGYRTPIPESLHGRLGRASRRRHFRRLRLYYRRHHRARSRRETVVAARRRRPPRSARWPKRRENASLIVPAAGSEAAKQAGKQRQIMSDTFSVSRQSRRHHRRRPRHRAQLRQDVRRGWSARRHCRTQCRQGPRRRARDQPPVTATLWSSRPTSPTRTRSTASAPRVDKTFGRADVLINNAAIFSTLEMRPFEQIPLPEWEQVLRVNVTGPFLCARAMVPLMRQQQMGPHHQHGVRRGDDGPSRIICTTLHRRRRSPA